MNTQELLRRALAATSLAIGVTGFALAQSPTTLPSTAPAAVAADADELTEVVVTGSRIRGVELIGSNVISIDREAILNTGAASASDLIRKLPQIVGLGASETAGGAQNGAANVTRGVAVNLRGVGSNSTLLLFGGRRMPPAGTQGQFTDASVVPAISLERLEVVADGGSAIYGSDAVTGVVNLIPRREFNGAETTVRGGFAAGYRDFTLGQIFGFDLGRGHVVVALEHGEHSALQGKDRSFYTSNLAPFGGSDLRSLQCSPGNILVGTVSYAIPQSSTGTGLTATQFTANTRNLCDNLKRGDIIPELNRNSLMLTATFPLNDAVTLFTENYFSKRDFQIQVDNITSNLTVTSANPFYFNPAGGTGNITVQYDFANDGGLPRNPGFARSWQALVGANFKFGSDWQAETYASYGLSADNVTRTQNLNTTTGGINAALALTSAATAFNPFGRGGISNPATVAGVRNGQFIIDGDTALKVFSVQADGPIASLPGGKLRLAVGAEYRRENLGGTLASGSTVAPVIVPSTISRNVTAYFAELAVPLISEQNAKAGAKRLAFSLSGRQEKYSDVGSTFNPKFGFTWQPLDSLTMRGSWGTSFRAPSLAEYDPRSSGYGLYGDTLACNHRPPATTCFGIGIAGGNADLKPEDAKTWSVGFEFRPVAWQGFRANVNYFNLNYKNQILALRGTPGVLTNPLYAPFRTLDPTAAQVSALLGSGLPINSPINAALVTYIQDGRRQNLGVINTSGYDFDLSQVWQPGAGSLRAGISGAVFNRYSTKVVADAAEVDVLGSINFPQRLRMRGEVSYTRDAWNITGFANYVGAYNQTTVAPIIRIEAYRTFDLHVGYDLGRSYSGGLLKGLSLAFDAQNIADQAPPFVNIAGGYDAQSTSPIGRLLAISLRKVW